MIPKISNIAFTSRYNVTTCNNTMKKFRDFEKYSTGLSHNDSTIKTRYSYEYSDDSRSWFDKITVSTPDTYDCEMEKFCKEQKIEYQKDEIPEEDKLFSVIQGIKEPPKKMVLVNINPKKLEELISSQDSNIKHCKKEYEDNYKEYFENRLKSKDKVPTTYLSITENNPAGFSRWQKQKSTGEFGLWDLSVNFVRQTDMPDECTYFALKDAGVKSIPVYMSKNTCKIAEDLGIIER